LNINDYGMVPNYENLPGIPARVTAVHKERYEIVCEHGITHARLKTKEYYVNQQEFPTTGDFVMVNYIETGDSQILVTLPRRTFFSRREPGPIPKDQAVAANFDYVFIMQSLNLDFNPKRLERYLTLAWQSGAVPVILLTNHSLMELTRFRSRSKSIVTFLIVIIFMACTSTISCRTQTCLHSF